MTLKGRVDPNQRHAILQAKKTGPWPSQPRREEADRRQKDLWRTPAGPQEKLRNLNDQSAPHADQPQEQGKDRPGSQVATVHGPRQRDRLQGVRRVFTEVRAALSQQRDQFRSVLARCAIRKER